MCNFRKNEELAKRQAFGVICPDPFLAMMSIPINFDHTISKCYYVQLQLLLAFHIIKI